MSEIPGAVHDALGRAFDYVKNQRERLMAVFSTGVPEIDNNASERDLRQVVLGRKNWLVAKVECGTEVAATFFSLIGTCKALDVNAAQYLTDVLERVGTTPRSEVATLTPWAWAEARENASACVAVLIKHPRPPSPCLSTLPPGNPRRGSGGHLRESSWDAWTWHRGERPSRLS